MSTLIKAGLVAATLLVSLSPAMAARFRGEYYGGFDAGYGGRISGLYAPGYRDYRAGPARVYFDQMRRYGN